MKNLNNKPFSINCRNIVLFVLVSIFFSLWPVSSVGAQVSGSSSVRDIATYLCRDETGPVREACITQRIADINAACSPAQPTPQLIECRQGFIDGDSDAREPVGPVVGPGDLERDCTDRPITPQNCGIVGYIRLFADAITVVLGIVVAIMVVVGGIQYSTAGNNPQAVTAAKKRLSQAILAVAMYVFLFAFMQWLVPGGVF
jgi:hypothetical protein